MNKLIVILIPFMLTACGGGSGGSEGQSQPASSTAQVNTSSTTEAQPNEVALQTSAAEPQQNSAQEQGLNEQPVEEQVPAGEGMEAVIVDESFDFQTDVPLTVSVAPNVVNSRAYLNVCKQGAALINDDNCFLRAPVDSTGLTVQIELPHSEQKLTAEIWYYSTGVEPLVYSWEFDTRQQQQAWTIN
ncbi:hypothetical protein [Pseudoalteromonas viridis]|uniref:Lipoprotein n=1 Tax=Pseudoalteromonas viridis TaxID=339617 RepID=A0ABX7V3Y3_9GAMM|nr:hypothetical protein [Pseudoalteromonas viridis]QTL34392.1 hypothetical protein J5X90_12585 [Pseudoalteromonas viridis]